MAKTKEIRKRIKSIRNTAKITHAMELVAAAKMKRAQDTAVAGKPYSRLINEILRSTVKKIDPTAHPLLTDNDIDTNLIIAISPDRGLAGPLIANLARELTRFKNQQTKFITIGKKVRSLVTNSGAELIADFPLPENSSIVNIRPITKLACEKFLKREVGKVYILYTEFHSTLRQEAKISQLLPITDLILPETDGDESTSTLPEYLFEPKIDQILEALLPHYILQEIYHYLRQAQASEHSARMMAMKNATDNALGLADDLQLTYNQIRQEVITSEISDIATAAVALG